MLHQRSHLLGRKKLHATFDPEATDARIRVHNEEDADPQGSYLIYDESLQRFIGVVRRGAYMLERPVDAGRARLTFFPAARA